MKEIEKKNVDKICIIADLKNVSMKNWDMRFLKIIKILNDNYAELTETTYVLLRDAQFIFTSAFNLISPILTDRTKKKIIILKSL